MTTTTPVRRRAAALGMIIFGAGTLGAASAATAAPATATLRALPAPGALNYASEPGQKLRQLEPSFVSSALGIPPAGALASLLSGPTATRTVAPPAGPVSLVRSPTYPCVNGRQTVDPLSPPCVASFVGDNGGTTYQGVTGRDVKVLVVIGVAGAFNVTRRPPWGSYYDLRKPPTADETGSLAYLNRLRLYQDYFNRHYETYGRRVDFVVYSYNQLGSDHRAACRNIAAENDALIHPFAVLIAGSDEVPPCYGQEMARRKVPTFYSDLQIETAAFQKAPGMLWSFRPDSANARALFVSYICQKVVNRPVVLSGNFGENGQPRRIGLLYAANLPDYARFAADVSRGIRACGAQVVDTQSIEEPAGTCGEFFGSASEAASGNTFEEVRRAMMSFQARRVTTVVWPGCADTRVNAMAEALRYNPEWVLWGEGGLESSLEASYPSAFGSPAFDVWTRHAVLVTPTTFKPELGDNRLCFRALRAIDPDAPADAVSWLSCGYYDGLRQLFNAFQLAGPRLTPAALDRGVRQFSSVFTSPQVPRCGYPAGDYTCIKDAQVDWWDRAGDSQPAGGLGPTGARTGGCWRAMQAGRRYRAGEWPPGNIDAQLDDTALPGGDPCSYEGSYPVP